MYYVLDNACATLEDAEEVVLLYKLAGVTVDIVTETEYFEQLHWGSMIPRQNEHDYWNDPV
tara:strand:- start:8946 stop:9128 length:183 start_codon:yes stop_codon:yes gene_type:complete